MSRHINCDHYDTEPSIEDGLDTRLYTSSIRVQYFRSFDYCVKWKLPMYRRQSSGLRKGSKEEFQGSPSPNESIHYKWTKTKKKKKRALRKTKVDDSGANTDDERDCDILDIDSIQQKHIKKDEGLCAMVDDEGVDLSDEECSSVSSICSGPFILDNSNSRKQRPSQGFCSACWNLYKKAKKMKAPIKNKLLDNDPNSLTCDQWVLLKKWRSKRVPNTAGQLLTHVHLVKKRLVRHAVRTNPLTRENKLPACLRQHVYLQRNLAKVLKVPAKPEMRVNRRKRPRDDSLGPRVVKQRFHSSDPAKHTSNKLPVVKTNRSSSYQSSSQSTSSGLYGWSEQEMDSPDNTHHTVELISSSVNVQETLKPQEGRVKPKAPKKTAGFRDLLAQMRANTSVIVREPRQ